MKFLLGLVFGLLLAIVGYWVLATSDSESNPDTVVQQPVLLDVFRFTLEDEVAKRSSVPKEGYTPAVLLQIFPGLVESDFSTVDASGGQYQIVNGTLQFKRDESGLVAETVGGLSRDGYATLLQNIVTRLEIRLDQEGTLTDVITAIAKSR